MKERDVVWIGFVVNLMISVAFGAAVCKSSDQCRSKSEYENGKVGTCRYVATTGHRDGCYYAYPAKKECEKNNDCRKVKADCKVGKNFGLSCDDGQCYCEEIQCHSDADCSQYKCLHLSPSGKISKPRCSVTGKVGRRCFCEQIQDESTKGLVYCDPEDDFVKCYTMMNCTEPAKTKTCYGGICRCVQKCQSRSACYREVAYTKGSVQCSKLLDMCQVATFGVDPEDYYKQ